MACGCGGDARERPARSLGGWGRLGTWRSTSEAGRSEAPEWGRSWGDGAGRTTWRRLTEDDGGVRVELSSEVLDGLAADPLGPPRFDGRVLGEVLARELVEAEDLTLVAYGLLGPTDEEGVYYDDVMLIVAARTLAYLVVVVLTADDCALGDACFAGHSVLVRVEGEAVHGFSDPPTWSSTVQWDIQAQMVGTRRVAEVAAGRTTGRDAWGGSSRATRELFTAGLQYRSGTIYGIGSAGGVLTYPFTATSSLEMPDGTSEEWSSTPGNMPCFGGECEPETDEECAELASVYGALVLLVANELMDTAMSHLGLVGSSRSMVDLVLGHFIAYLATFDTVAFCDTDFDPGDIDETPPDTDPGTGGVP